MVNERLSALAIWICLCKRKTALDRIICFGAKRANIKNAYLHLLAEIELERTER
jgi:hypothetical protein